MKLTNDKDTSYIIHHTSYIVDHRSYIPQRTGQELWDEISEGYYLLECSQLFQTSFWSQVKLFCGFVSQSQHAKFCNSLITSRLGFVRCYLEFYQKFNNGPNRSLWWTKFSRYHSLSWTKWRNIYDESQKISFRMTNIEITFKEQKKFAKSTKWWNGMKWNDDKSNTFRRTYGWCSYKCTSINIQHVISRKSD